MLCAKATEIEVCVEVRIRAKKNSATLVQRGALCRNFVSLFCIKPEFGVTVPQQAQFSCRNQEPKQTPPIVM